MFMFTGKMRLVSVVMALVTMALSGIAMAQNDAPRQGRRGGRMGGRVSVATVPVAALASALNLTADQKTKITAIQSKYQAESKALRPTPGGAPDPSSRQKMRDLTQQTTTEIEAVLTDAQKAKVPDLLKEMGMLRGIGIPLEAVGELKLTEDQKTKLADIAKQTAEKMQGLAPEARREGMQEAMKDAREKAMSLLTDAQKKTLKKYARPANRVGNRRDA
jgi:Spy/CpxP family protein refolding chaperone